MASLCMLCASWRFNIHQNTSLIPVAMIDSRVFRVQIYKKKTLYLSRGYTGNLSNVFGIGYHVFAFGMAWSSSTVTLPTNWTQ